MRIRWHGWGDPNRLWLLPTVFVSWGWFDYARYKGVMVNAAWLWFGIGVTVETESKVPSAH
jgi:hypothetical protein